MRVRCPDRRVLAIAALALVLPGCMSGYLFAAGRRREYAREVQSVTPDADATVVRYVAEVVDDDGEAIGTVVRIVRLPGERETIDRRELTRVRTEPWVYAVLPLALALDAVVTPTMVLLAPAPLLVGD
jgi:hypothetical protein